jgi:hypothetical protein
MTTKRDHEPHMAKVRATVRLLHTASTPKERSKAIGQHGEAMAEWGDQYPDALDDPRDVHDFRMKELRRKRSLEHPHHHAQAFKDWYGHDPDKQPVKS